MLQLSGRVAVVSGGGSGIGRATATLFAEHGAEVVVGDLHPRGENVSRFADLAIQQLPCDVRREDDVRRLIAAAVTKHGRLDIVVHSAGIVLVRDLPDASEQDWDDCFDTNVKGAFLLAKHAIPAMRASGGGSLIAISSNAGLLPRAHDPIYSTSKAALIALVKCVALSHSLDGIRANAICPGPVCDTGIIDDDLAKAADPAATKQKLIDASPLAKALGRMVTPLECAQAALYLASDAAAMVTGTCLAIDGGKSLGVPPVER